MKTLFLSSVYPNPLFPVRGTFNRMLCHALNEVGEVRVVAPLPWPEVVQGMAKRLTRSPVKCKQQRDSIVAPVDGDSVPVERPVFLYPPKFMRHRYGQFMWSSVRKSVERVTADFRPDWVVSYWAHPDGDAGLRAARLLGAKSAVIVGGSDVLLLTRNPKRCAQIKRVLQESDAVLAVCEGLKHRAIELGASPDRVHRIYQGIDPKVFCKDDRSAARGRLNLSPTDPAFVWVGRMVGVKRLDVLVTAFELVVKQRPEAKLYLLGEGAFEQSIRQLVENRRLSESVIFVGAVQQSELPDWYRAADATLLSSESEGLPNVLRESLACGTPWVSTNVGSVEEIAAADHSIIVPVGDAQAMAEGILQSLEPVYKIGAAAYRAKTWRDTAIRLAGILSGNNVDDALLKIAGSKLSIAEKGALV
jgi:teichuronic acid biosynthesis glycosyltransferase TuaC